MNADVLKFLRDNRATLTVGPGEPGTLTAVIALVYGGEPYEIAKTLHLSRDPARELASFLEDAPAKIERRLERVKAASK